MLNVQNPNNREAWAWNWKSLPSFSSNFPLLPRGWPLCKYTSLVFLLGIWKHVDFSLPNQMSYEMLDSFISILIKLNLNPSPHPPSPRLSHSRVAQRSQGPVPAEELSAAVWAHRVPWGPEPLRILCLVGGWDTGVFDKQIPVPWVQPHRAHQALPSLRFAVLWAISSFPLGLNPYLLLLFSWRDISVLFLPLRRHSLSLPFLTFKPRPRIISSLNGLTSKNLCFLPAKITKARNYQPSKHLEEGSKLETMHKIIEHTHKYYRIT